MKKVLLFFSCLLPTLACAEGITGAANEAATVLVTSSSRSYLTLAIEIAVVLIILGVLMLPRLRNRKKKR